MPFAVACACLRIGLDPVISILRTNAHNTVTVLIKLAGTEK
jgi:hypothetical protein